MFYWYLHLWFDYVKKNKKKPRENQNKKQYSRTLAKAKIQKTSRKQKNQKKQYSRTLAKVQMQKSKKPRENQKKKQKKQYSRSLEIGSTGKSPGTLVFLFFWFSPGFLDFCIFTFARVLEYCFFGFLEVFWIFAFARVLEYCFFCLVFSRFFKLFFVFFKLFCARNFGQGLVPSEGLEMNSFWYDIVKPQVLMNLAIV